MVDEGYAYSGYHPAMLLRDEASKEYDRLVREAIVSNDWSVVSAFYPFMYSTPDGGSELRRGNAGRIGWNQDLVDYNSALFEEGFALGQTQADADHISIPPRKPEWSDAEWATYAEAVLMGSCEPVGD